MANFKIDTIAISGIASAIPEHKIFIDEYETQFGKANIDYYKKRTGLSELNKSIDLQNSSDLGYVAANAILDKKGINRDDVGVIVFVSKSPDYRSPATAIVLHSRLKLNKNCLGFDVNIGGAGFIYGMEIVPSLLDSSNKKYGILVVGDTMSKQLAYHDPLNMFYADGASAVLFEKNESAMPILIHSQSFSEDYNSMIIPGGFRGDSSKNTPIVLHDSNPNSNTVIKIDENAVEKFVSSTIPNMIKTFLQDKNTKITAYDFFVFPQLEEPLLNELATQLGIPLSQIVTNHSNFGDSCGNGIPLLISKMFGVFESKTIKILAVAYGEGLTCGIADFCINSSNILEVILTDDYFKDGFVTHEMPS